MKQITSIETEIGKIVSQLTKEMLEKGLILTRFETGGINSWTRILVFSSTETTRKQTVIDFQKVTMKQKFKSFLTIM